MDQSSQLAPSITDWVSAIASGVSTVCVIVGLFVAWCQLDSWKTQVKIQRKTEVTENIMWAAFGILDVMKRVRSQWSRTPEDKIPSKNNIYEERIKILDQNIEIFEKLREYQQKAKIIIQDNKLDNAINKLFQARLDYWISVDRLVEYSRESSMQPTEEERNTIVELRNKVFGNFGALDQFGRTILEAVDEIEVRIGPIIRLNDR